MVYYTLLFNFFTYSTHMLSSWKLHTYEHYLKLILTQTTSTMFNPFKMIQMHPKNLLLLTSHQTNVSFWTSCIFAAWHLLFFHTIVIVIIKTFIHLISAFCYILWNEISIVMSISFLLNTTTLTWWYSNEALFTRNKHCMTQQISGEGSLKQQ